MAPVPAFHLSANGPRNHGLSGELDPARNEQMRSRGLIAVRLLTKEAGMEELTVRQVTSAPASELRRAMEDLGSLPEPSLTLTWRGRARVRALEGKLTAEVAPDAAGRNGLACRYRFGGLFARLITRDGYDQLKGNLQYIAAVICHRAEELHAASSDGRPPPVREAGGRSSSRRGVADVRQ